MTEYEARLAQTERLMAELLEMQSRVSDNQNGNENRERSNRRKPREPSRSNDWRSNESSRSPSPTHSRRRPNDISGLIKAGRSEEFFKVPELLPMFKFENEDPEAFVDDFNTVLECIDEASVAKTILWFKNRDRIPASNWDAGLSPRKDSLRTYQRAFLKYFWSASVQRLAVENGEKRVRRSAKIFLKNFQNATKFASNIS